jgi:hypothetical protein
MSGSRDDRPGFAALIEYVREGDNVLKPLQAWPFLPESSIEPKRCIAAYPGATDTGARLSPSRTAKISVQEHVWAVLGLSHDRQAASRPFR